MNHYYKIKSFNNTPKIARASLIFADSLPPVKVSWTKAKIIAIYLIFSCLKRNIKKTKMFHTTLLCRENVSPELQHYPWLWLKQYPLPNFAWIEGKIVDVIEDNFIEGDDAAWPENKQEVGIFIIKKSFKNKIKT